MRMSCLCQTPVDSSTGWADVFEQLAPWIGSGLGLWPHENFPTPENEPVLDFQALSEGCETAIVVLPTTTWYFMDNLHVVSTQVRSWNHSFWQLQHYFQKWRAHILTQEELRFLQYSDISTMKSDWARVTISRTMRLAVNFRTPNQLSVKTHTMMKALKFGFRSSTNQHVGVPNTWEDTSNAHFVWEDYPQPFGADHVIWAWWAKSYY